MRPLALVLSLVLAAGCHDRTAADAQSADAGASDGRAGRLHMIVDVAGEGPPKVEGSNEGSFVELRAEASTPFARVVEGVETAKHLGGGKFLLNLGDRRTKPFVPPPFDPSGAAPASDALTIDDAGALTVNGTKVASAAAARDALGGDASTRAITVSVPRTARTGAVMDVLVEITPLGRPIAFSLR